jgi:hypothetical protein
MEREVEIEANTPEAVRSREQVVANAESSVRKETMWVVDDELLEYIEF